MSDAVLTVQWEAGGITVDQVIAELPATPVAGAVSSQLVLERLAR